MKQVQNCFEYTLKCYTFENIASVFSSSVCFTRYGGNRIRVRWKS